MKEKTIEKIIAGALVLVPTSLVAITASDLNSTYRGTPEQKPQGQLTENFVDKLKMHMVVSGTIISESGPMHNNFFGREFTFNGYIIKSDTDDEGIYAAAHRGQKIFKKGDHVTVMLGFPIAPGLVEQINHGDSVSHAPYRPILAYTK